MRIALPVAVVLAATIEQCRAEYVANMTGTNLSVGSYLPIQAPVSNIFRITKDDENSVTDFVTAQENITIPGPYTVVNVAVLPPNKTEALSYLDGGGHKPNRYAHVSVQFDCYMREYMVGPLPVDNSSAKLMPLDYIFNGNGTEQFTSCGGPDVTWSGGMDSPYDEVQDREGKDLPGDERAAPIATLPDGARHYFDPAENYVSWMDFSFFTTVSQTGLGLFDIRFRGERIIYELGMQEALAHYAGVNADASQTAYLDVYYGFVPGHLVPGWDCPAYATYSEDYSFCLFEFPKDYPMQRHTDTSDGNSYHITKNIAFLLRAVSTVGNYDYQITYEFHLDGSIQVIVRASGYIAWTEWTGNPLDPEYGFHIRPNMSGSLHDHVLNFKLDMDIKGTANSLFKTEFEPITTSYAWANGSQVSTMHAVRSFIDNEDDGKINWATNSAAMYAVVNKDRPNAYGELPGFKIVPMTGAAIHSTIQNSTVLGQGMNWAKNHLYALRRKDTEPSSTYIYNYYNKNNPLVNFDKFFDGESLDQEDLVIYFNLGMHHMPDTSDLPTTVFTNAQSGMMIRPVNYLNSDGSRPTRQQVNIVENGTVSVNYYGQRRPQGTYSLSQANPDLASIFAADEADQSSGGSV